MAAPERPSFEQLSRMNSAFVIFLNSMEKVNSVVQRGVVIQETFMPVMSLVQPAKKIILSNFPPFIKDELLISELSRHGKIVSQMKKISLNCKSPLLKHVICFIRQIYMILNNNAEEMNVAFKFRIDGFDYVVFAITETMKCFDCGHGGHIRLSCPERAIVSESENARVNVSETSSGEDERTGVTDIGVTNNVEIQEQAAESEKNTIESDNSRNNGDEAGCSVEPISSESEERKKDIRPDEVGAVAEPILELMDTEQVNDEAIFKTPITKRKRLETSVKKGVIEQVAEIQHDDTDCRTLDDSESEGVEIKSRRNGLSAYTFDKKKGIFAEDKN